MRSRRKNPFFLGARGAAEGGVVAAAAGEDEDVPETGGTRGTSAGFIVEEATLDSALGGGGLDEGAVVVSDEGIAAGLEGSEAGFLSSAKFLYERC